jgi:hypothetical protein
MQANAAHVSFAPSARDTEVAQTEIVRSTGFRGGTGTDSLLLPLEEERAAVCPAREGVRLVLLGGCIPIEPVESGAHLPFMLVVYFSMLFERPPTLNTAC